jgi:hypothetical protein
MPSAGAAPDARSRLHRPKRHRSKRRLARGGKEPLVGYLQRPPLLGLDEDYKQAPPTPWRGPCGFCADFRRPIWRARRSVGSP